MTKEDFYIIRNSITMRQLAEWHGFQINRRGFIKCPFHAGGAERTPSLQVYSGYRGFYCRACGQGGDVIKFTELYENLRPKEAVLVLSERFNIPVSDNSEVPQELIKKANKAVKEKQRELARQQEIKAELRLHASYIHMLKQIISNSEPYSYIWCYCQNELPKAIGNWERLFQEMRAV